jgi:hypothetical protein
MNYQVTGAAHTDRYTVVVFYADGVTSTVGSDALSAAEAKQDVIRRLAEQLIEWPPHCCPQALETFSRGEQEYCPACLDDLHAATCPNLTRTGQG